MNTMLLLGVMCFQADATQEPDTTRVADQLRPAAVGSVHVEGLLGERIDRNRTGRLEQIPMAEILDGFQHRPGKHAWIGEHIGKWLHAAVLAWQYSQDAKLKNMIDQAVRDLLATQKEDGYLGTYEDTRRWTSWDVWVHKYDLIGLLAYYRSTGDEPALQGARRIGDLLEATFGPGKRSIIAAGTHVGMAATSILEPMVGLYRVTGDARYLAFCQYMVESWEGTDGPKLLSSLLSHGKVNKTANGKAYEMMSNLVGLCELYRATADERYLKAARNAWDDIAAHQCYLVGGTSLGEHFQPDGHLPDTGPVAETCANVTWMQLSMQLLALTGETKYADAIEQLVYNHLLGAQAEDGNDWCYFTVLRGTKEFTQSINCCHSSGPRGIALIPSVFYGTAAGRVRINLYGESKFHGEVAGIGPVEVRQRTAYPGQGRIAIEVRPDKPATFRLELRIPPWSRSYALAVNDQPLPTPPEPLAVIDRPWRQGDIVTLSLDVAPQWIPGTGEHAGKLAARKGPLILCASARWNPEMPSGRRIGVVDGTALEDAGEGIGGVTQDEKGLLVGFKAKVRTSQGVQDRRIVLGPFALVQHEDFVVWLSDADHLSKIDMSSLLFDGREEFSRRGNVEGSIVDGDLSTYRVTANERRADRDWWQVTVDRPTEVRRVVFHHGHVFHDGGWFDTASDKPEVFVRLEKDGSWKPVGRLETYPQTTADKPPQLDDGQGFELVIPPTTVYGVRVAGKPACGDNAVQAFSSCAELAAFGR